MQEFFQNLILFLDSGSVFVYIFIFVGKIAEVAIATLRMMLINRGERLMGVIAAILEYTLWIFVTASAITNFQDDPMKVIVLIIAFALGNLAGSILEEKLAFGLCTLSVVAMNPERAQKIAHELRYAGYAVTTMEAEGISGNKREILTITARRKFVHDIIRLINKTDPHVMITIAMTSSVKGGYLKDKIKKQPDITDFLSENPAPQDNATEDKETSADAE